jgi:TonB family protein
MKVRIQIGGSSGSGARRQDGGLSAPPLTASVFLHGLLIAVAVFGGVLFASRNTVVWGEEGLGGGDAVPVNLLPSVPLPPSPGPQNPLASNTKEFYPAEKKPPAQPKPQPSDKDFLLSQKELKKKLADLDHRLAQQDFNRLKREIPPNAIPGRDSSGRASAPMYGMATGQGSGGIGFSGEFGALYGWYVSAVKQCIATHWDRSRVDASIRAAPRVYVEFDIERSGVMQGERVATSSNIPSVDREALRAVQACSGRSDVGADVKLPELPRDYKGANVHAEVWFEFKK